MRQFSIARFGYILTFFSLILFSCQKDGYAPPPPWSSTNSSSSSGSMVCKVDGSSWSAAAGMAAASLFDNASNVTGMSSGSSTITFTINEAFSPSSTYNLDFDSGNAAAYTSSNDGSSAWLSNGGGSAGGILYITTIDTENKLISGLFYFDAIRATDNSYRHITDGEFTNLSYGTSASGPGENTFTVDIDAEPFAPAAINGLILGGKIRIVASDAQGVQSVSVSMPEDIAVGTYDIGGGFSDYSGMYNPNASISTLSNSGTLIISTHDTGSNFIEGSFEFTSSEFVGPASFELTNGEFSVSYQ